MSPAAGRGGQCSTPSGIAPIGHREQVDEAQNAIAQAFDAPEFSHAGISGQVQRPFPFLQARTRLHDLLPDQRIGIANFLGDI
jgi:hypothetical protein